MSVVTTIESCTTTACAYNDSGCTAYAITIAGSAESASCGTFVALDVRGGLSVADSHVGACQRLECTHNSDLMCSASAITVGGDTAACLSYQVA